MCAGDRGRSKKWKEMLRLPPVAHCLHLRDELGEWGGEGVRGCAAWSYWMWCRVVAIVRPGLSSNSLSC